MITYVQGGFFTSPAAVLVNTVNTVGIMGKGIAKEFKAIYPEMFESYQLACERGELTIGTLQFYRFEHKSVLNFPTKQHWKQKSRVADIEAGLITFVEQYERLGINTIAFPQLGCGNGELDWESQVRPLMENYLDPLPIDIYVHIYDGDRDFIEHRDVSEMKEWLRHEPRALGFEEVWADMAAITSSTIVIEDWEVSLLKSNALRFQRAERSIEIPIDDVLDQWQQLRSFGLISVEDIPSDYKAVGGAFLSLLEQLSYVDRTEFVSLSAIRSGEPRRSLTEVLSDANSRGVRLVAWPPDHERPSQLGFFDEMPAA